ncbi:MAG: divalent-cation tolerance protein CutA [Rickettsiales bacterium]|nr:divalent-cation tolerance protein CutA [Rickettsiales bacterium]
MKLIYSTFKTHQEALQMAKHLLKDRMVACANINQPHTSVYEWQGKICEDEEVAVWFKTTDALWEKVKQQIKEHHLYDCPCILVVDVKSVDGEFDKWMQGQVSLALGNKV